jgi:triosephosphate isomerase
MGETDAQVNAKVHAALAAQLIPIVCIGETEQERDAEQTEDVVLGQLTGSLAGLSPEQMAGVVLAYEPVWAIGTGETATPEQAREAHAFVRSVLRDLYGEEIAHATRIQYGGSVTAQNAAELMGQPGIDGALVGGASLKPDDFVAIVEAARD